MSQPRDEMIVPSWEDAAARYAKWVEELEAENNLLRELVAGLDSLLVCYRLGKHPSDKLLDTIAKTRKALEKP